MTDWKKGMPIFEDAVHSYENAPLYVVYHNSYCDNEQELEQAEDCFKYCLCRLSERVNFGTVFRDIKNDNVIFSENVLDWQEIKRPQGDL